MSSAHAHRKVRILFTGGPHGGKTSMLDTICAKLKQRTSVRSVVCVPESATGMIRMMQSVCGNSVFDTAPGLLLFQRHTLLTQIANETAGEEFLRHLADDNVCGDEKSVVVGLFDRGVWDGRAFVHDAPDAWSTVIDSAGLREWALDPVTFRQAGLPAYDLIVHLESMACGGEGLAYSVKSDNTNTQRLHDQTQARECDANLRALYGRHPRHVVVCAQADFEQKSAQVWDHVLAVIDQKGA